MGCGCKGKKTLTDEEIVERGRVEDKRTARREARRADHEAARRIIEAGGTGAVIHR